MVKRLAGGRKEEILDGVMQIIAARGFSTVTVADIARRLHCSTATLYRITPNKDGLVLLAIRRWGDRTLEACDAKALAHSNPAEQARTYFMEGARSISELCSAFRRDVDRFESTRSLWLTIVNPWIDRFAEFVEQAVAAGEICRVNVALLAQVLRQIGEITRNEDLLAQTGLTASEALMEVDAIIWEGILCRD